MASISEQGHNRNAVNFDRLIINCSSYGAAYNPNKASLKIEALQALALEAQASLDFVNDKLPAYKNSISARKNAFANFDKLITRINSALIASDITKEIADSAKTIIRKLQGRRASSKKRVEEIKNEEEVVKEKTQISSSQMSYDSRIENFDKLIKLLSSVNEYSPNEEDLKVTSLLALHEDLKSKNIAVINAQIELNNARIRRNNILYAKDNGLIEVAGNVKFYLKSVFGASSPQFKTISGIRFTKGKN